MANPAILSSQQKDKLLSILEHPKYREFAKPKCSKSRAECDEFWNKASVALNSVKGVNRSGTLWKRCWRDQVRYVVDLSKSKARVKAPEEGNDSSSDFVYTMDNPFHDRIMNLVGWELADAYTDFDDDFDKENSDDPLWVPSPASGGNKRTRTDRSCSPLGQSSPTFNNTNRYRSSPTLTSPQPSTSQSSNDLQEIKNLLEGIVRTLEANTKQIEELKASFQTVQVIQLDTDSVAGSQAAVGLTDKLDFPEIVTNDITLF